MKLSSLFVILTDLAIYQIFRRETDWIKYKKSVRTAKRIFFDNRI